MASYDVIVIGSGPGGYVSAIRCAQLGLKTACVEGRDTLGGTCLNVGCIPSKALLHASHQLHEAQHNFAKMGLIADDPKVDWAKMQGYKTDVIDGNTKGIEFLFKKNKIDWLKGWGSIPEVGQVKVGDDIHEAKHIIIATGSEPSSLPGIEIDEKTVVTSTGALALSKIPRKMVVIGAGVIGLELGSVYARLGAEVEVIEYLDNITPGMDGEVQKTFQRILKKQGLKFTMGAAVQAVAVKKGKATVSYVKRNKDSAHEVEADVVLVATGRRPYVDGLGLDALGVALTSRGQIQTDANYATSVPGIYAIGDAITGPMLAHKAEDEGMAVAEILAGQAGHVNYDVIPGVIYTHPEVATGRSNRRTIERGSPRLQGWQVFFHGQRSSESKFCRRWVCQTPRGRPD
jgi:dihydrolipoamide dehydrogenase